MNQIDLNYNIVLIGYRGTGKSTIGLALKKKLKCKLISTDELIVKESGMTIPDLVSKFGWVRFREVESKVIKDISSDKDLIIDCGGGVVEDEGNMRLLKKNGKVVLLTATVNDIILRTQGNKNRPSFKGGQPLREEIESMINRRYSMYKKYADFTIDTSKVDMETTEGINAARDRIIASI